MVEEEALKFPPSHGCTEYTAPDGSILSERNPETKQLLPVRGLKKYSQQNK